MKVSVICVTDKPRGLDLTINGLLGQVQVEGYESRQVYDKELDRIVVKHDVPIYKRFKTFELVFGDTSGADRKEEVDAARRLAAGQEAVRKMLPDFGFTYVPKTKCSIWEALLACIEKSTSELLVFIPDLGYLSPHFLETHAKAQDRIPVPRVGNVITRTYPRQMGGMDLLGALLDPWCETDGEPFQTERNMWPGQVKVLSIVRRAVDWPKLPKPSDRPEIGYELNAIAGQAAVALPGEHASVLRLNPIALGLQDPKPQTEEFLAHYKRAVEVRLPVLEDRPAWWRRLWAWARPCHARP